MTTLQARLFAIAGFVLALTASAPAQEFPTKQVRIIVPFAPGGLNDLVGRMLATHLTERFGRQVIVENRTGAGGVVGTELVANSPKDGHTLLIVSIAHAVNPWLYKLQLRSVRSRSRRSRRSCPARTCSRSTTTCRSRSLKEFIALAKTAAGQDPVCLRRRRRLAASRHGAVQGHRRHRSPARPVQRRRSRRHRRDRRPHQGDQRHDLDAVAAHPRRASCARSASAAPSAARYCRMFRPSRKEACPATRPATGSVSRRRRARPTPIIARSAQGNLGHAGSAGDPEADRASTAPRLFRMARLSSRKYMDDEMAKWGKVVKQAGIKAQ